MINKEKGLGLDQTKLTRRAMAILEDRDTYFNDIITKIREKMPALKIIYANNMTGAKLNPDHPSPDFLLIMSGVMTSSDPKNPDRHVIIIDAPPVFTERSIAGWTMAVEAGNMQGYFDYMLEKALRIDRRKFHEYITVMCNLSLDPESELYWKRPENTDKLVKELMELYLRYNTPGERQKMNAYRGYTGENNQPKN